MMLLKQFTDTYEKNYPEKLRNKTGAQSEAEIQQGKLKLKRVFCNSNVTLRLVSSRRSSARRLPFPRCSSTTKASTCGSSSPPSSTAAAAYRCFQS